MLELESHFYPCPNFHDLVQLEIILSQLPHCLLQERLHLFLFQRHCKVCHKFAEILFLA